MAKRTAPGNGAEAEDGRGTEGRRDSERDLVAFYSRLVGTLEHVCGGDALARRLAELRRASPSSPLAQSLLEPAFSRMFRRLGFLHPGANALDFAQSFALRLEEAVTRPPEHILQLLALFCQGDPELSLKAVCGATALCHECLLTRECDFYNNPRKPAVALMPPAERLLSGNALALSDAELLSVLLFGERATGQEPLTETLLSRYGRLRALFRADAPEYSGIRDMGRPHALRLAAANALHRRLLAEQRDETPRITCAKDIFDRYAAELREYRTEAAVLLLLDQQNTVIRDAWFCDSSPTIAHVDIADLLRPAVREIAVRIALVHNHPSNNPSPSVDDIEFTRRLRAACDIVGIGLLDHVVVTEREYYSFMESAML